MASKTLRGLLARKASLQSEAKTLMKTATEAGRELTEEESTSFDAKVASAQKIDKQIEQQMALEALDEGSEKTAAVLSPDGKPIATTTVKTPKVGYQGAGAGEVADLREDPKGGFKTKAEMYDKIIIAGRSKGTVIDRRLFWDTEASAATTFGSESVGEDGGYLVPPEFASDIFQLSLGGKALLPYTNELKTTKSNSLSIPKDETTPWDLTKSVQVRWLGEAIAAVASKPYFGTTMLVMKKIMALVPVTDELLSDSNALESYLPKKVGGKLQWALNTAILFGDGVGKPYGCMKSGAAVVVTKDSNQSTNTLSVTNIGNMFSRLPEDSIDSALWLIHPTCIPALMSLQVGNIPIFLPIANTSGAMAGRGVFGTLLGVPVMMSQLCQPFSSQGDILLLDLKYYNTLTKKNGPETAVSMHLYFDADETAFRTITRIDGQSMLSAPIQPANGSVTLSPFIQLGAR